MDALLALMADKFGEGESMAPTLPHGVWSLDVPQPEATALRAVRMCAGTSGAAALSPEGGGLAWGGPVPFGK